MNRKRWNLPVCLLAAILCLSYPLRAAAEDTGKTDVQMTVLFGQTEARRMLDMINGFRTGDEAYYWNSSNTEQVASKGEPLAYSYALEEIAMQRAAECALSFSHTRPDGTRCFSATAADGTRSYGENIAAGSSTAASGTMTRFPSSFWPHRARPENRCRIMVAPSTEEFRAGSSVSGSEARHTASVCTAGSPSVSPPDAPPFSEGVPPPQAARDSVMAADSNSARVFFIAGFLSSGYFQTA